MTKSIFKAVAASSALMLTATAMPTTAQASDSSYDRCVAATWDHIGCWLQDTFGIMNVGTETELKTRRDRISKLQAAGVFKAQSKSQGSKSALAGNYKQTCSDEKLLAVVEKYRSGEAVVAQCFVRVDMRARPMEMKQQQIRKN